MEEEIRTDNGAGAAVESPGAMPDSDAAAAEIEQLTKDKAELQEQLLRRAAEFENFRRRAERDRAEFAEYAGMEMVKAILPTLDDFERALKAAAENQAAAEFSKGFELIYQRLLENLTKQGLEPVASIGQKFDPYIHHAVKMDETDEAEDHTVLEEYQRGYNFKGKLLRPSMVRVAVNK